MPHCEVFHTLCRRFLHLDRPDFVDQLHVFLFLRPHALRHEHRGSKDWERELLLRATAVYALYKLHCASHHGQFGSRDPADAFRGYIRDASAGCSRLARTLDMVYQRPCASR